MPHTTPQLENSNYVVKLERYSKDISQIASKLNSYSYEPTTKDLFDRKTSLKEKMDYLKQMNSEIIDSITSKREVMENQIMAQVNEILNLKSEFQEYHNLSNNY